MNDLVELVWCYLYDGVFWLYVVDLDGVCLGKFDNLVVICVMVVDGL